MPNSSRKQADKPRFVEGSVPSSIQEVALYNLLHMAVYSNLAVHSDTTLQSDTVINSDLDTSVEEEEPF